MAEGIYQFEDPEIYFRTRINYIKPSWGKFGTPAEQGWHDVAAPTLEAVTPLIKETDTSVAGYIDFYRSVFLRMRCLSDEPELWTHSEKDRLPDGTIRQPTPDTYLKGYTLIATNVGELSLASEIASPLPDYLQDWLVQYRYSDRPSVSFGIRQSSPDLAEVMARIPHNAPQLQKLPLDRH